MRRVLLYGVGWLAAATAAALLAWQGVGRVGTHVTDRHAAPLTAEQARRQLERTTATGGAQPGEQPAGGPATTASGPDGGGGGRPGSTGTTDTTRGPGTTTSTAPRSSSPSTTATTGPGPGTPTSTAPPPGATETRTYNLVGGSATLRFSPSGVSVVLADPNPGFSADVDDSGGRVRVRFESDSHRSQVEAWWDGGPRDEVREEGGDGGSGGRD